MIRRSITAIMLVAMATCFGLGVNSALADDVVISSDITTSTLWSSEDTYYLDGIIFVTDGATLTIEPGTIVRGMPDSETSGNNNPGTLVVARGSKIFADGTSENPIVFTDMNDDNVPGGAKTNPLYNNNPTNMISENWGGVILLGATYLANDTESGPNAAREEQVEGITREDAVFGGGDDDDSSGSMSYVSIRYGGYGLLENEEINGLTLGAVGRGTTLHHIEVANNVDDGIEFFGGTVNTKYIIIWNIGDDSMDSDEGYRGKSQFGLVVKGACKTGESGSGGGVGNNGFEMDGGNHPDQSRPYALSQWRNYTLIGMGAGTTDTASDADNGFEIRDNARPQIYHTIVMDMGGFAVDIEDLEDPAIDSAGGWTTAYNNYPDGASFYPTQQQGNQTEIADCLFYNTVGAVDNGGIGVLDAAKMNSVLAVSPIQDVQRVDAPGYSTIKMVSTLDPRPTAAAMGTQKELPTDGFFTPVDYYGAFSADGNWAKGWSLINAMGVLDFTETVSGSGTDVVVSSDITASTTWTRDHTYILDGIIFVTDGASLTIEPGTVVRGMPDSETSGNNNPGTLVVARGSKIFADGTSENPIVFTDMNDDNVPGGAKTNPLYNNNPTNMISENWGGVILLGATYLANDTESGPNAAREEQVEGITREDAVFGGGDDDDSSGSMSYVSIRYGGYGLLENEEINGLTLGAVGRGTTLHHIEVANNVDDGIEFFGGTVNTKYIIIWNIGDDSMDSDEGYRGKSQFGLVVKGACKTGESGSGGGVGNNGFEMDGGNHPDQSRPYALSQWRNYTLIGMGAGTTDTASDADNGFEIRDNARPQIYHTIVMDMGGFAVDIEDLEDPAIDSAGGWTTAYNNYPDGASFYPTQQQGNQTEIADCLFYNTVGAVDNGGIGILEESKMNLVLASSPIQGIQRVNAPGYSTIKMVSALDPRPTAIALDPIKELPTDGFFTPVDYYGAFSPAGNWADGWSLISSMGVLSIGSGQSQGFDEASYRSANPDLPASWTDAQLRAHYRAFGYAEGRLVYWDASEYKSVYPDLAGLTDAQALAHYRAFGKAEGRVPFFQADQYLAAYPDLAAAGITEATALLHYRLYGRAEGRVQGFDYKGYLELYADLPDTWTFSQALSHYIYFGKSEGRTYDPYVE